MAKFTNRFGIFTKEFRFIAIFSVFFKEPLTLLKFIIYSLTILPAYSLAKYRRIFGMINFIIRTVKKFFSTTIQSYKLQFKGVIGYWKRSRTFAIQKGNLPLTTIDSFVEYASSKVILRRSVVGLRL